MICTTYKIFGRTPDRCLLKGQKEWRPKKGGNVTDEILWDAEERQKVMELNEEEWTEVNLSKKKSEGSRSAGGNQISNKVALDEPVVGAEQLKRNSDEMGNLNEIAERSILVALQASNLEELDSLKEINQSCRIEDVLGLNNQFALLAAEEEHEEPIVAVNLGAEDLSQMEDLQMEVGSDATVVLRQKVVLQWESSVVAHKGEPGDEEELLHEEARRRYQVMKRSRCKKWRWKQGRNKSSGMRKEKNMGLL